MRKIIHIDMDCFYAAVEMRDNPELLNVPLAIGGDEGRRGVLCTSNYQARKYGVRAAMPSFMAKKLCPDLIILPPRFDVYRQESDSIRKIFARYTEFIEPLSLDEAYLDVTTVELYQGSATLIAQAILNDIWQELRLTASAGVASNKLIAKIASDENKPNGICIVTPDKIDDFIANLPVKKLFGVGPKLQQKLENKGINNCKDLQKQSLTDLVNEFGKMGVSLYQYSRGIDSREVTPARKRKSISVEWTFEENIESEQSLLRACEVLYKRLLKRWLLAGEPSFNKLFVKLKFDDFKQHTKEQICNKEEPSLEIFILMMELLNNNNQKPIRLLGLGLRIESYIEIGQLEFEFDAILK